MERGDDHVQRLIVGGYAVALHNRGAKCASLRCFARGGAKPGGIAGVFLNEEDSLVAQQPFPPGLVAARIL